MLILLVHFIVKNVSFANIVLVTVKAIKYDLT